MREGDSSVCKSPVCISQPGGGGGVVHGGLEICLGKIKEPSLIPLLFHLPPLTMSCTEVGGLQAIHAVRLFSN